MKGHFVSSKPDEMRAVLKKKVVPVLREMGFKGSFPHFYREREEQTDLFNIQFGMGGVCFYLNIAYAMRDGSNVLPHAKDRPVSKVTYQHVYGQHCRSLGGLESGGRAFFFQDVGVVYPSIMTLASPDELADEAVRLIREEAEPWWRSR